MWLFYMGAVALLAILAIHLKPWEEWTEYESED
jgi:hypothetical protein